MARKRVSLKDKGPEALGLTDKKSKSIDVLLGGPTAVPTGPTAKPVASRSMTINQPKAEVTNMAAENNDNLSDSTGTVLAPPSPPAVAVTPESLPVNEADHDANAVTSQVTDELGLPVAQELSLTNLVAVNAPTRAVDELGLPVALESSPIDVTVSVLPSSPPVTEEAVPVETAVVSTPPASSTVLDDNDLSGLAGEEEDLSGPATTPAVEISTAPVSSVEPTVVSPPAPTVTTPAASEPVATTPVVSEPVATTPTVSEPVVTTPTVSEPVATTPTVSESATSVISESVPATISTPEVASVKPVPAPPPISTLPSTVSTSASPLPTARIESFGGIVAAPVQTALEDILPEDIKIGMGETALQVTDRAKVEKDARISEQVARYIGKERREALDKEIERLYDVVSEELSDNNEDVSFALKALSEAQDIVLEDIRQYDEALYRVAMVKTMLVRRRNLKRWSYSWGTFVFFYAVTWLSLFIACIVLTGNIDTVVKSVAGQSQGLVAVSGAWYSALAGGIGGIIGILYSLYWRVAVKQNFDRQYIMYYLVQPIMGFVLGAVTHLIITAGFLTFNATGAATSNFTVILQLVVGFIAGFRQKLVYEMIDKIVQRVSPKEEDKTPVSVVPEQ